MIQLDKILTESQNSDTQAIDQGTTLEILQLINQEDKKVPEAVAKILPEIAQAVDWIVESFQSGGHLFYLGAGTSGRLGILDASECPPTYNTPPEMVQGIIAGGQTAIFRAVEGAEDDVHLAETDLKARNFSKNDVLVGIAASGRTPYVIGGLKYAASLGAKTISLVCTDSSEMANFADLTLAVLTGPEAIMGSTRMKAGTAQKLVLNMLTTASMVRLGKTYGNLMVDVQATNLKLIERGKRIVMLATGCQREQAEIALQEANGSAKIAILMILTGTNAKEASKQLEMNHGFINQALNKGGTIRA